MAKTNAKINSRSIRRVAIDRHFLDHVQIRLHSEASSKSISDSSAPVERHRVTEPWAKPIIKRGPKADVRD